MLEFQTLGGVALRGDGVTRSDLTRHSKCLALLAYICVAGDRTAHRRDKVVAMLWPESDEARGRASLRKAIFQLRRCLGDHVIPRDGDEEVGVDSRHLWCDAVACREALEAEDWCLALELYGGPLLDGLHLSGAPGFERWLEDEREALRRGVTRAAWTQVDLCEEAGALGEAVRWALRAVELAPYDEAGFRRMVALCGRNGDRATALDSYERYRRRLREDLEVEPAFETRAAIETLRLRAPGPATSPSLSGGRPADPSVAILPFASLSVDGMGRLFADGLHHELVYRLGGMPGCQVTSRTSVMQFRDGGRTAPEIGRQLRVGTLVEGTVHVDARRVRVTLEMIDADRDRACWCGSFEGALEDPLQAQVDMAREMATRLARAVRERYPSAGRGLLERTLTPMGRFPTGGSRES